MEEGKYSETHEVTYSETRWYEKTYEFLRFLPHETPVFIATSLSMWGVSEILVAITGGQLSVGEFAGPTLLVAFAVALLRAFNRYTAYVPDPLKNESKVTKAIYRKQKCGWQFAMGRQMLSERIARTEASLERIRRSAEYVEPKLVELSDYLDWLKTRPTAFLRLSRSICILCTEDIPNVLANPKSEESLSLIVIEIDALAGLYERLKEQELSCYEIVPPQSLEQLHELTHGWSETIRAGVNQFLGILSKLASINRRELIAGTVSLPSFSIVFESPPAVEKFTEALNNVDFTTFTEIDL